MPRRPNVPLQMVGGRPVPGSELRARPATPVVTGPAPSASPRQPLRTGRELDQELPSRVPPTLLEPTPTPLRNSQPPVVFSRHIKVPRAREARVYLSPGVAFNELAKMAARSSLPVRKSSSALPGRLYGQALIVGPGQVDYQTTSRMEDWLSALEGLSLNPNEPVPVDVSSSLGGEVGSSRIDDDYNDDPGVHGHGNNRTHKDARCGDKRAALPTDDEHDTSEYSRPLNKRARFAGTVNAAFKRTATAMSRAGSRLSRNDALDIAMSRAGTPFSIMSRALATDDNKRKVKICLLGDTGAGKTALLNRLIYGTFHPPDPSIATDYRVLNTWIEDTKETVHVEVWEFPGSILSSQRNVHLMSTFFHAAVICYSIEDVHNLESLASVWKPALDASLHDRPLFVLGLKKDLRPTFPELGLAFLPATERVTSQHGFDAATITRANGYAECSAKTGENCFEAWEGIVSFVVSNLAETERELSRNKSAIFRGNVKDSAKETAKDAGRAVNRVFSWIPKLSQKMKDATAEEAAKRRSTVSESAADRRSH